MNNGWVLVFDTETTGLGPEYKSLRDSNGRLLKYDGANTRSSQLANGEGWPENVALWDQSKTYIAQISYIMYNLTTNEYRVVNKFISDIPEAVTSELLDPAKDPEKDPTKDPEKDPAKDASNRSNDPLKTTHPIVWATLKKAQVAKDFEKATILKAMTQFIAHCQKAEVIVAHNAEFDRKLVFCELTRLHLIDSSLGLFDIFLANQSKLYCTMCVAKDIVRIDTKILTTISIDKKSKTSTRIPYTHGFNNPVPAIKTPALWEVYDRMFGYPPDPKALHDALADVVVCLRVFYRLWMTGNTSPDGSINFDVCGYGEPDIYGMDARTGGKISEYIDTITPPGIDPEGNFFKSATLRRCFTQGKPYDRTPDKPVSTWQDIIEENRQKAIRLKRKREAEVEKEAEVERVEKTVTSKEGRVEKKVRSSEGKGGKKRRTKRRSKKIKIGTNKKIRIRKRKLTRKVKVKYTRK